MHLLFADNVAYQTVAVLKSRGHCCSYDAIWLWDTRSGRQRTDGFL